MILPVLFVILIVAADQIVKYLVRTNIQPGELRVLADGVLGLTYVENSGAAFGMLQGMRWLFVVLTIIALAIIVCLIFSKKVTGPGKAALTMILGGAMGNLIDRARSGYVVDMFELLFMRFAIFNVADIFVTAGGVLLCIYVLFFYPKHGDEKVEDRGSV